MTQTTIAPIRKPGDTVRASRVWTWGEIAGACDFGLWEPPKLTEKGRDFKPKLGQPGSTVVFDTTNEITGARVRMSGEVWSDGPTKGSVYVVKDQIAYLVQP